jgi:hypothetical protein
MSYSLVILSVAKATTLDGERGDYDTDPERDRRVQE